MDSQTKRGDEEARPPSPPIMRATNALKDTGQILKETGWALKEGGAAAISSLSSRLQGLRVNALKVVTSQARHLVSQNKRRYMDGEFDLDLAYITESIIAMGFPAGDISSGIFGYMEGFYRNHMEEVIRFLDTHHKDHYKVFNLCSERLYDPSLFEGLVACFPFDDHNCPPLQMVEAFCESAYRWLKAGMDNVVVVHCKAGKARTGLMVCCLLLHLKLCSTADEAISFYNQKRCVDGRGLILPSQKRYVHYYEQILQAGGTTPPPRKCVLRGVRLLRCPPWIRPSITVLDHAGVIFSSRKHPRTRNQMPDDIWHNAPRKGVVVFALPGERCVADLEGDFKILLQDRHGDFYLWLNTSMIGTRTFLGTGDLDWFDKRRLPSPGFQVEVVILDPEYDTRQLGLVASDSVSADTAPGTYLPTEHNGQGQAADSEGLRGSRSGEGQTGGDDIRPGGGGPAEGEAAGPVLSAFREAGATRSNNLQVRPEGATSSHGATVAGTKTAAKEAGETGGKQSEEAGGTGTSRGDEARGDERVVRGEEEGGADGWDVDTEDAGGNEDESSVQSIGNAEPATRKGVPDRQEVVGQFGTRVAAPAAGAKEPPAHQQASSGRTRPPALDAQPKVGGAASGVKQAQGANESKAMSIGRQAVGSGSVSSPSGVKRPTPPQAGVGGPRSMMDAAMAAMVGAVRPLSPTRPSGGTASTDFAKISSTADSSVFTLGDDEDEEDL